MKSHLYKTIVCLVAVWAGFVAITPALGKERWTVPLGGNAYLTSSSAGSPDRVDASGIKQWQSEKSVFSVYFRADRAAVLDLSLRLKVPDGDSEIRATVGESRFEINVSGADIRIVPLGKVTTDKEGYVRVILQGLRKTGPVFADVGEFVVESEMAGLKLDYVKDAAENRFYWGRRGPSVHLGYDLPVGKPVEYFYSEVRVPEGQDPIGSYFMANGFGEGYFGIQVNGEHERRILFSVWSPFQTDNPKDIPEEKRIEVLGKGKDVRTGEFGNEGSGGQSFLIYPWKAGTTYRFLNSAKPDGRGSTIYTAWFFAPEVGQWHLIASFRRPETEKYLTGLHSFLENFADWNGYQGRMAFYGNQWARDIDGIWHELTKARFTGDDVANRQYRLDYAGGFKSEEFFLRNGGFFGETVKLGTAFERKSNSSKKPDINLKALEVGR